MTSILIIFLALAVLSANATFPDPEVVYRWGEHLKQWGKPFGFFAEFRELAHMYTAAWLSVACISKTDGTVMPGGMKKATNCSKTFDASIHAAANAAIYNIWVHSTQTRRNIFDPNQFFWNTTEQTNIITAATTMYNLMKTFIGTTGNVVPTPTTAQITSGDTIGTAVGEWLWSFRKDDGADKNTSNFVAKCTTIPNCPIGIWWPYSANGKPPVPNWAELTLLCDDPDIFEGDNDVEYVHVPPPPPPFSSSANQSSQLIFLYGNLTSSQRTADQLLAGRWWNELPSFVYFTPIMRAINDGYPSLSLVNALRALMHVAASTFDSNIIQFHHKLKYQSWRPWQRFNRDYFQGSPTGINEFSLPPGSWIPQSMQAYPNSPTGAPVPSPNHPDYPAGHPMSTGAWTHAFELVFPDVAGTNFKNNVNFRDQSMFDNATNFNRTFTNLQELGEEVINARMFVGYHFVYSSVTGHNSGRAVADKCHNKLKQFTGTNPDYGTYGGVIPTLLNPPFQYKKRDIEGNF